MLNKMSKTLKISIAAGLAAVILLIALLGIVYQVKWSSFNIFSIFKKDFASNMSELKKEADSVSEGSFTYKLKNTKGHTVTYTTTVMGISSEISEHYSFAKKFDSKKAN